MARIRTIKPEFPQSESMGCVSREARLLFILLWTVADDAGRTRAVSRMLASLLYPYDNDAPGLIDAWLGELERQNCITRYTVDGATYLQICNWLKHQKIDKPSGSKFPPLDECSRTLANVREASRTFVGGSGSGSGSGSEDLDRDQDRKRPRKRGTRLPDDWQPSLEDVAFATAKGLSATATALKFRNYWIAKAGRDAVKLDWSKTWQNWCITEAERRPGNGAARKPEREPTPDEIAASRRRAAEENRATAERLGLPPLSSGGPQTIPLPNLRMDRRQ